MFRAQEIQEGCRRGARSRRLFAGAVTLAVLAALAGVALSPAAPVQAAPLAVDPNDGPEVVVKSVAPGQLDLFTVGPDRALHHRAFRDGKWSGWEDLGGSLASAPAVGSFQDDHLDVFARGTDDRLWHRVYYGGWKDWEPLGDPSVTIASAPAVGSFGSGHFDVFARGKDNHLWHINYWNTWRSWENLGGDIRSTPAVHSNVWGHFDVFARGADDFVRHWWYQDSSGWHGPETLPGKTIASAPAIGSFGQGHVEVFARGKDDNHLWHNNYVGGWSGWVDLGGDIRSTPSVGSWGADHYDIYALGADNALWLRNYYKEWHPFARLGGNLASAPMVASWGTGRFDVFASDPQGAVLQAMYDNNGWSGPSRVFGRWKSVPIRSYSRSSVMQLAPSGAARVGMIGYSYVDNIGRLRYAQSDPDSTAVTPWSTLSSGDAYTGPPALAQQPDGRLQVAGVKTDSDVGALTQQDPSIPSWGSWRDAGGWVTSDVTSGRLPDGRIVLFAVDGDGVLFANQQTAVNGEYGVWRAVGDLRVAGAPAVAATQSGLRLFTRDTAGVLRTADYEVSGSLSAWADLGAVGSTGAPAVVVYPGYRMRVFVRAADGTVVTKVQDTAGAWPVDWQSTGAFTAAGAPVAILDPVLGRTAVVARGADNEIYVGWETGQGTGAWGTWGRVLNPGDPTFSDPAATDPTVAPITNSSGETWYIVFRTTNDTTRVYQRTLNAPAVAAADSGQPGRIPAFTGRSLPMPPT